MFDTTGRLFIFLLTLFLCSAVITLTGCGGNATADDIPSSSILDK